MNQMLPTTDPLLWEALPDLNLNIAQTAELCGISVRQLGYWTRQGYVKAQGKGNRRTYGLDAVRHLLAIRKAMLAGASLRQALRSLSGGSQLSSSVSRPSTPVLAQSQAALLSSLAPDEMLALAHSLQSFFAVNRHTRDYAGGLAIKMGRAEEDVRAAAESLCASGALVSMQCRDMTIFRRARQEASHA